MHDDVQEDGDDAAPASNDDADSKPNGMNTVCTWLSNLSHQYMLLKGICIYFVSNCRLKHMPRRRVRQR